jgi:hypothetical protein
MNNPIKQLEELFKKEKENGLFDIKIFQSFDKNISLEERASDILKMFKAFKNGKYTIIKKDSDFIKQNNMKINAKQAEQNTNKVAGLKAEQINAKKVKQSKINGLIVSGVEQVIEKVSKTSEKRAIIVDSFEKWSQAVMDEIRNAGFNLEKVAPLESSNVSYSYKISW